MKVILLFFLLFISIMGQAQSSVKGGQLYINTSRISTIETIPFTDQGGINGEVYLFQKWHYGTLKMGRLVENQKFRYDINNDLFEVIVGEKVRYLRAYGVSEFSVTLEDSSIHKFKRADQIEAADSLTGYIELVIEDKPFSLIAHHYNVVLDPNYIHGLDVGSRKETSLLKVRYFFLEERSGLIELEKKKIMKGNAIKGYSIKKYIKENKVRFKRRKDLMELTSFLNQHANVD